jgi:hypothetical protein
MPTEDDLRAALRSLEAGVPDVDAVLPRGGRGGSARRRTVLLAGAAAVTVAAVPVTALLLTDRGRSPAARTGTHPLEFDFTVWSYDEYAPTAYVRMPGRGQEIHLSGGQWMGGTVTVYEAGGFDGSAVPTDDPVTVGGRPGFFTRDEVDGVPGMPSTGLFWEYAPDAWANAIDLRVSTSSRYAETDPRAATLRLADAVRFGPAAPMRIPYRLGALPDLWPVTGRLQKQGGPEHNWHSRVTLEADGGRYVQLDAVRRRNYAEWGEPVFPAQPGEPVVPVKETGLEFPTFVLQVGTAGRDGGPGLPAERVAELVRSVTPAADFDDQGTWFEPREAFPS